MADEYQTAGELGKRRLSQRLRRVRRRPGLERLGAQGNDAATSPLKRVGHVRADTLSEPWSSISTDSAISVLQSIEQADLDGSEKKRELEEAEGIRALWEPTLPKALANDTDFLL